jgi:hypothetical protein
MNDLRDIVDVYNKINFIIPNDYVEFKKELKNYIDSLWNKAPEVLRSAETYIPFSYILMKYIPNICDLTTDEPSWKFNVKNIFEGNRSI